MCSTVLSLQYVHRTDVYDIFFKVAWAIHAYDHRRVRWLSAQANFNDVLVSYIIQLELQYWLSYRRADFVITKSTLDLARSGYGPDGATSPPICESSNDAGQEVPCFKCICIGKVTTAAMLLRASTIARGLDSTRVLPGFVTRARRKKRVQATHACAITGSAPAFVGQEILSVSVADLVLS